MLLTAELRFFWEQDPPPDLENWFLDVRAHNGVAAGAARNRTDVYLVAADQTELGIKKRNSNEGIEVKGLVMPNFADLATEPFSGPVDLWSKWICEPLNLESFKTVAIDKTRLLRKFDTYSVEPIEVDLNRSRDAGCENGQSDDKVAPTEGCTVELTKVTIDGRQWWTLGFEAFGSLKRVSSSVKSVATLMASRQAPSIPGGLIASYPQFLVHCGAGS